MSWLLAAHNQKTGICKVTQSDNPQPTLLRSGFPIATVTFLSGSERQILHFFAFEGCALIKFLGVA